MGFFLLLLFYVAGFFFLCCCEQQSQIIWLIHIFFHSEDMRPYYCAMFFCSFLFCNQSSFRRYKNWKLNFLHFQFPLFGCNAFLYIAFHQNREKQKERKKKKKNYQNPGKMEQKEISSTSKAILFFHISVETWRCILDQRDTWLPD